VARIVPAVADEPTAYVGLVLFLYSLCVFMLSWQWNKIKKKIKIRIKPLRPSRRTWTERRMIIITEMMCKTLFRILRYIQNGPRRRNCSLVFLKITFLEEKKKHKRTKYVSANFTFATYMTAKCCVEKVYQFRASIDWLQAFHWRATYVFCYSPL